MLASARTALAIMILLASCAAWAAGDEPGRGCLYGTVTTGDGRALTGFLRTDNDDAFWDDIFRSSRKVSPWADLVDTEALAKQRRAAYFNEHGLIDRIAYVLSGDDRKGLDNREFLCRYGQIARIILADNEATVETTDGVQHVCRRRGADLRGDLTVAGADSVVVDWDDVREVVFAQAPPAANPPWRRLSGTVTTSAGTLRGFIQWDRSECTSDGILDGEQDREEVDLPMGDIAAIAKERDGSRVTLRDGRSLHLTGTNDVNADNRGIAVEVAGLGRVTVPWTRFERVDFAPPGPSGPGREAYPPGAELHAAVALAGGETLSGRVVWDLDEGWTWDIFNGEGDGLEYEIPFGLLGTVTRTDTGCRLELRSGTTLDLDEGQDAGDANRGVLLPGAGEPRQISWQDVVSVDFAP